MMPDLQEKKRPPKPTTAEELAARLGIEVPPMVDVSKYPPWLLKAAKKAVDETFKQDYWKQVVKTTREDLKQTIEDAIEEGISMRDIADEIEATHGAEYTKARAMNVARTESASAMNQGHISAMKQVEDETGIAIKAEWLSVNSVTSREAHMDLDGTLADDDGMFDLNGVRIPYPGHWSLPASDRCNCMCTILAAPVGSELSQGEESE